MATEEKDPKKETRIKKGDTTKIKAVDAASKKGDTAIKKGDTAKIKTGDTGKIKKGDTTRIKKGDTTIKKGGTGKFKAVEAAPKPAGPAAAKPEEAKKPERQPASLILVAEDTTPIRNIIRNYLMNAGFEVMDAPDGVVALELATARKPDLALLDINMPRMDGYSLCKALRQKEGYGKIPILICTARGLREDVIEAIKVGANDYIVKPFTRDILIAKVKKYLALAGKG